MALQGNNAEGGSNTTVVSVANSGGSSGTAFAQVATGGGLLTFTSVNPLEGLLSYRFTGGAVQQFFDQSDTVGASASMTGLAMFSFTALPTATHLLCQFRSAGAQLGDISIDSAGMIRCTAGSSVGGSGSNMAANTPYYIRWQGTGYGTASTALAVQVYDISGTLVSSVSASGTTSAQVLLGRWGKPSAGGGAATFSDFRIEPLAFNVGSSTAIALPTSNFTGTLDTAGDGTLVAAGSPRHTGSTALSGSGTLVTNGTPGAGGTLALSGSGTLAATGRPGAAGSAALSGSGTLGTAGTPGETGTLTTTGAGTLAPTGVPAIPAAAGLSGAGTLTAAGSPRHTGTLALSGSGTLQGTGGGSSVGSLVTSGSGTLALAGAPGITGVLGTSGAGSLGTTGAPTFSGVLSLSGQGTASATGLPSITAALGLSGSGTLQGLGGGNSTGALGLSGAGTLTATGTMAVAGALGLSGLGALSLLGTPVGPISGALALSGGGTLSGQAVLSFSGSVQLGSIGYLRHVMGVQVGFTPSNEMVAVAWLKQSVPYLGNRVATELPGDNSSWSASGFTTVATTGGTPNIEVAVNEPVMSVDSWGVALNSARPPWNLAAQPAEAIKAAAVDHGTIPKILVMPVGFNQVRVFSVVPRTEPRRVNGDGAGYAHYQQDLEFRWVKA